MSNFQEVVGWLYDILDPLEWRYTPREVLETEERYPGLFQDLAIEAWQRRIIKQQIDNESKK